MRTEDQRKLMVEEQIILRGIKDKNVIKAFLTIERHLFVQAEFRHLSYEDSPLGIGNDQTISQPYTVAFMLELAELQPEHKVLEIGTGSGYQTALLATIVKEVYTIERISELSFTARNTLDNMHINNVHYQIGDGSIGWDFGKNEPLKFDRIIVTAASPDIPQALMDQLALSGRMIIPTGEKRVQKMMVVTKKRKEINKESFGNFVFVPLIGKQGWNF